jgi:hypothetical protein
VKLGANLLVVAMGGFDFKSATIGSRSSTTRNLYLVQPYNAVTTHPCTSTGVNMESTTEFLPTVRCLSTPPARSSRRIGESAPGRCTPAGYGEFRNNSTMTYSPLPVFGVNAVSTTVKSYAVDVLYKRETTPLTAALAIVAGLFGLLVGPSSTSSSGGCRGASRWSAHRAPARPAATGSARATTSRC